MVELLWLYEQNSWLYDIWPLGGTVAHVKAELMVLVSLELKTFFINNEILVHMTEFFTVNPF